MSCNCCGNGNSHFHGHIGAPFDCDHINHVFDPDPPAFYGTWNHLYGFDVTNRVSVTQPGVDSGLYRKCGPLSCGCCCNTSTMLTNVQCTAKLILSVTLVYTNKDMNKTVDIIPGNKYTIQYLDKGNVVQCSGVVTNIYKVEQLQTENDIYKIRLDCSVEGSSNVVVIKSDQIRGVEEYIKYADEDTTIRDVTHNYGTTLAASIDNAIIIDAELDANKNIVRGTIIAGTLTDARTVDGVAVGTNNMAHKITLLNAVSYGGEITGGMVLNGVVRSGDVDGDQEETGYITHATIKGSVSHMVIINTRITQAYTKGVGKVIDPTLKDSIVVDATVSGTDMVTTGGVTSGDLTTGAITHGGIADGGTSYGFIDGLPFVIVGGTTKGDLTTSGGVVAGGTIIGGIRVGNVIQGATIKGGVARNGTTYGGTTTGGTLMPAAANETPIAKSVLMNPDYDKAMSDKLDEEWARGKYKNYTDLLLMTDRQTHTKTYTNIGTAVLERVPNQNGSVP